MKRYVAALLSIAGFTAFAQEVSWPPLPTVGFIAGRAATNADVAAGNAAFVAARGEVVIGKPLLIDIPQYAWSTSTGKKVPVVVIQAEEAGGKKILGARLLSGAMVVGLSTDFELLGKKAPR